MAPDYKGSCGLFNVVKAQKATISLKKRKNCCFTVISRWRHDSKKKKKKIAPNIPQAVCVECGQAIPPKLHDGRFLEAFQDWFEEHLKGGPSCG